jgi:pyruvate formate lyase activating enzyme
MTVVPFLHKEEDVYEAVEHVKAAKRFYIQEFKPNNTLNPSFSDIKPFSAEKMEKIRQNVSEILSVRNAQDLQDEIVKDQQDESP